MDVTPVPATATEEDLDIVFEPFQLKSVALRNRIVRTSHSTGLSAGAITDDLIEYHLERARGEVALSFAEAGEVHWSGPGFIDLSDDTIFDGLNRMASAVQAEGMKLFQQLQHCGPAVAPHDGTSPWAASPITDPVLGIVPRPMTKMMIDEIVGSFARAAGRVKAAGLDGVEVHGGHSYLFSNFLSPATNRRDDDYGQTLINRARLLTETLTAMRAAVGPDFVIGVRLSPDGQDGQSTLEDIIKVAQLLEADHLVDYINASYGSHYRRNKLIGTTREPRGYMLPITGQIARATSLPTMVTGRILSLADAARALRNGDGDLISMVRALLADPQLITKTRNGHAESVRPCISCNQACAGGLTTRGRIGCVVNVGGGRELHLGDSVLKRSDTPSRVLVVGGGPAGMEAARVAAIVGHQVTLVEAEAELGGQLRLVRQSPSRSDLAAIIPYFEGELEKLGVEVQLGRRLGTEEIATADADAVIMATGSQPRRDGFQAWRPAGPPRGLESVEVLSGWDVLGGAEINGPVLLLDEIGHYESIDVAEFLVRGGNAVNHVTRFSSLAPGIPVSYEYASGPHLESLDQGPYQIHTRSVLLEVAPGYALIAPLEAPQRVTRLDAGTFVFMSGHLPDFELLNSVEQLPTMIIIGDAAGPRMLEAAFTEGHLAPGIIEPGWSRRKWVRYGSGSAV